MAEPYVDKNRTNSYIFKNGKIIDQPGTPVIMVSGSSDLATLAPLVSPGTIAYTAGWLLAWQLDLNGSTWVSMYGGT